MPTQQLQTKVAVRFVESSAFTDFAESTFTAVADRGLKLILADNPRAGSPVKGKPGLFELPYEGCTIIYGVSPDYLTVYLLQGEKNDSPPPPPPPPKEEKTVTELLKTFVKGGVFAAGKNLVEDLIEYLNK